MLQREDVSELAEHLEDKIHDAIFDQLGILGEPYEGLPPDDDQKIDEEVRNSSMRIAEFLRAACERRRVGVGTP